MGDMDGDGALNASLAQGEPRSAGDTQPARMRVILNPNAGQKVGLLSSDVTLDDLRELLERHGVVADLCETTSAQEAREQARDAVERGYAVVVAAGGDGTAGCVARELLGADCALGILPLGSVMNLCRMLGIPRDLDEAANVLATGCPRPIDVGVAGDTLFYECASVGMIAPLFREVQRMEEQFVSGALSAIMSVVRYRPGRMVIHLDDRVMTTRSLLVTVANGPYTGIGLTVAPRALVDDGLFDVQVFRRFGRLGLVFHLLSVVAGRKRYSPRIRAYRSSRVRIESRSPLPCRADSNDLGVTPVEFALRARALKVIVPREAPGNAPAPSALS